MSAQHINIVRVTPQGYLPDEDSVAVEEPLEINIISGRQDARVKKSISITMRTPGDDEALACGFLFTEGIIHHHSQIEEIIFANRDANSNSVTVAIKPDVVIDDAKLQRNFYTTSSCGVCGKASLDALKVLVKKQEGDSIRVSPKIISSLPQLLREKQSLFEQTGGLHASALLTPDGELLLLREDVGRHNALDKVIGTVLMQHKISFAHSLLMLSGRISFELVQKAAVAGIPFIAAVGAPSSLAVSLGAETGVTLVGFVRGETFNVYAGGDRITK